MSPLKSAGGEGADAGKRRDCLFARFRDQWKGDQLNVELVFCQQNIQAPVVGSDFLAGKAPYLCLCNVCAESYPRTKVSKDRCSSGICLLLQNLSCPFFHHV